MMSLMLPMLSSRGGLGPRTSPTAAGPAGGAVESEPTPAPGGGPTTCSPVKVVGIWEAIFEDAYDAAAKGLTVGSGRLPALATPRTCVIHV